MHQSATQAFDFLKVHHDLSDRFFEVFLDQHYLLYGTALYLHPQASLDQAAQSQLQRVCEKLSVIPTDHLFDAGSGWGGLGLYAAKYYGAKVTILSQSLQHQKFIQAKAYLMNVQHLVTLIDRETLIKETHSFNKIALLTPMNLVGHLYAKELIEQLSKTLDPRGLMLIQTLTQIDEGFGALIESFMQRYFFDSYTLYSLPMFFQKAVNHSGLKLLHLETMDEHVARTFIDWYQRLQDNRNRLVDTGLTPTFLRLYDAYIALFYAGACTRKLQGTQILLAKNNYQGNDWLLSHAKSGYFPSPLINNH